MQWWQRLQCLIDEKGWSKAETARRAGIPYDRLVKFLRGEVEKPRGDSLKRLSEVLGADVLWIEHGVDLSQHSSDLHSVILRPIPLFDMDQLDAILVAEREALAITAEQRTVLVMGDTGPKAFGVVVPDDAMDGKLKAGDIAIIDPDAKPIPGKVVLAVVGTPQRAVLRRYTLPSADEKKGAVLVAELKDFPDEQVGPRKGRIIGRATFKIERL